MKYQSIKKDEKVKHGKFTFDKGINSNDSDIQIDDGEFSFSKNIIFEKGILKSRNGIMPVISSVIGNYDNTGEMIKSFTLTDTEVNYENEIRRIGYNLWGDNESYENLNVYLLSKQGVLKYIHSIAFTAENGGFYRLKNVFFTVGKKTRGAGIYAFVKSYMISGKQTLYKYQVFEYTITGRRWMELNETDYYIPVIYLNGRGTAYSEAKNQGAVYSGTPACPEEINLLGGRFKAYFSSDGVSSDFKLPVTNILRDSEIICRVYSDTSGYTEWIIPANAVEASATYSGNNITLSCDRLAGVFSFNRSYSRFPIPKTNFLNGNNICFTCVKNLGNQFEQIIGSKNSASFNSRVYVYGNDSYKNEIYSAKYENPLYFPETMKTSAGSPQNGVNSMISCDNSLFCFKDDGVYKITASSEAGTLSYETPVDSAKDFSKPDRLKSSVISSEIGCNSHSSVCKSDNTIYFFATNKKFYSVKEGKISATSDKIQSLIDSDNSVNVFCCCADNKLFAFFDNRVYVNSKNGWSYFELPTEILYLSSFNCEGEIKMIVSSEDKSIEYLCEFSGDKDKALNPQNPQIMLFEKSVEYNFKTKKYDFSSDGKKKNIKKIDLDIFGIGNLCITAKSENSASKQIIMMKNTNESLITLYPFLHACDYVSLEISGLSPFELKSATVEYKLI